MFIEGARYNCETHMLDDSKPKELFTDIPIINFDPIENRVKPTSGIYKCPIYKTVDRRGILLTTGHSTNFVLYLEVPTDLGEEKWIMAGVAGFLALGY